MKDEPPIEKKLPYITEPIYFQDGSQVEEFVIPRKIERLYWNSCILFNPFPS